MKLHLLYFSFLFAFFVMTSNGSVPPKKLQKIFVPEGMKFKNRIREDAASMQKQMERKGKINVKQSPGLVTVIQTIDGTQITREYIIRLKRNADLEKVQEILNGNGQLLTFNKKTRFIIVHDLNDRDLDALRSQVDNIEEIEEGRKLQVDELFCTPQYTARTWGLDRIDDKPNDDLFQSWGDGTGVDAYILDTGINGNHKDFGGRVTSGWHPSSMSNSHDNHGHGTHVASTVGGAKYGVAKNVNLIPVKVCGSSSCSMSHILAGLNWVKTQVQSNNRLSVINMSLGGSYSRTLNDAVDAVLEAGIPVVVAAGNEDKADACTKSPASVTGALTVGATTKKDNLASFSNIGPCVDIYAPGKRIKGAAHYDNSGSTIKSGTSMAAPHVSGAVAGLLQVLLEAGLISAPSLEVVDDINNYIPLYGEKDTVQKLPGDDNNNIMLQTPCLETE